MEEFSTDDSGENPEEILSSIIDSLRQDEATDIPLLDIISEHVVKLSPAVDAIELAVEDIESLATKRGERVD